MLLKASRHSVVLELILGLSYFSSLPPTSNLIATCLLTGHPKYQTMSERWDDALSSCAWQLMEMEGSTVVQTSTYPLADFAPLQCEYQQTVLW